MNYSLIIPYFRTPEITRLALFSIFKFCRASPEVIVVDNAPEGPESAMLAEFPRIRLIKNPTAALGTAANLEALDIGVAAAQHDLIGLLHSDTVFLQEGWDEEMFGRLERENLAALGTFEREANPFRPLRKKIGDWWRHCRHERRVKPDSEGKLMFYFLLTRKSVLRQINFVFLRDGHVTARQLHPIGQGLELLSTVEISRFMWHISNVSSLLTGQLNHPRLVKSYTSKRERFLNDPWVRAQFKEVLVPRACQTWGNS